MRYLFGFMFLLAGLVALPLSVSAQDTDRGWVDEFYPELAPRERPKAPPPEQAPEEPATEPAPEEPALQLRLDDAGVEVVPGYPPSFVEIERRMKKAKVGLGVSAGVSAVGLAMGLAAAGGSLCLSWDDPSPCPGPWVPAVGATGAALFVGGLIGMFFGGVMLRKHKQDRNNLREAHRGTQGRVQWDLARSRLVF